MAGTPNLARSRRNLLKAVTVTMGGGTLDFFRIETERHDVLDANSAPCRPQHFIDSRHPLCDNSTTGVFGDF
jgi:hypothetical protein